MASSLTVKAVHRKQFVHGAFLCFTALLTTCSGCSGEKDEASQEKDRETTINLDAIQAAYEAASDKYRRPPRDRAELEKFLADGVGANVFRSPRDEHDFVIAWGADLRHLERQAEPVVIAYEKDGSNGERFVLTSMGTFRMTDEEFAAAKFPPGHKP